MRAALAILDLLATKGPAVNGAGGKAHLGNVTVMVVEVNGSQAQRLSCARFFFGLFERHAELLEQSSPFVIGSC